MSFDIAYVSSYNEFDHELLEGLHSYFSTRGLTVGVIGYASTYVQRLHEHAGYEFINLRDYLTLPDLPKLTPEEVEECAQESFQEVIFPEKQYYQSSDDHLTRRALNIFAAVAVLNRKTRFKLVVHKLGAEILRKAMLHHAKATVTPSCFLGTFPTIFPGKSYYHDSLSCERDFLPPPKSSAASNEAKQWIQNLRKKKGVITYPSGGGRSAAELLPMVLSLSKHGEWEFLRDIINRRLVRLRFRVRGWLGNWFAQDRLPESPFFFFPLHVFDDSQITVRNPHFFDQYWIIEYLSRLLPQGHSLVVKMHPGVDGSVPIDFLLRVRSLKNVVLVQAGVRATEVIPKSRGVIVVNSTVALESLLLGVPVLVLGHWAFGKAGVTRHCEDLRTLGSELRALRHATVCQEEVDRALAAFYDEMLPGSYYQLPRNWADIGASLESVMSRHRLQYGHSDVLSA